MRSPHRKRIQVAVSLLGELVKAADRIKRGDAVEILKKAYQSEKIQPIRGKAVPEDIYDKEMATLYVVGKHGLKLDQEYPELFDNIFYIEGILERALHSILEDRFEVAREELAKMSPSGTIESNTVARLLRLPLTMLLLGFLSEEDFKNILHKILKVSPEEEKTVRNYAKFFIGLLLTEAIYRGEVRNRDEKEAFKKALAIRINFLKSTPSDEYVRAIAKSVYDLNDKVLEKILGNSSKHEEST